MTRSRLLLAVAAVLAGAAALFVVLGAVFNLLLVTVAVPFGLASYLLWLHATGRLWERIRPRIGHRERRARERRTRRIGGEPSGSEGPTGWGPAADAPTSMDRREAFDALDLAPDADQQAVRRAYRARVKAVHPDADGGDEDEFRRVRAAYERLRAPSRGKG